MALLKTQPHHNGEAEFLIELRYPNINLKFI